MGSDFIDVEIEKTENSTCEVRGFKIIQQKYSLTCEVEGMAIAGMEGLFGC